MALAMPQPEEEIEEKEERAKKDSFYGKERERETAGVGRKGERRTEKESHSLCGEQDKV